MDHAQIEERVVAAISTVLKRHFETVQQMTREHAAEWDSLKHMEIMFVLEDEFGTEFSEEELADLDSASKIVSAIEAKHAA
ncbi:acyl carrier protein [Caballeronia telluris]|uniref:Acyl carrier protein n=1 Tax=Caballeronia telluris TaxID=326475 RepID=A0A158IXK4_9BURK|nr:acyl carrier protein [Caballeronia telluris]SAL61412.1 acyl carrier protein [Caballeronia telluris]